MSFTGVCRTSHTPVGLSPPLGPEASHRAREKSCALALDRSRLNPRGLYGLQPQGQADPEECLKCDAGRRSNKTGLANKAECEACKPGRRSSIKGATGECEKCAVGRYSAVIALDATSCAPCPRGFAQSRKEQTSCEICLPGNYQNEEAKTACHPCSPGNF